jgi:hypothetical protein
MNDLIEPKAAAEARKHELAEHKLVRRSRLEAIDDYVGLVTTKLAGAGMVGVGVTEWLTPDFIAAVLPQPLLIAGAGIGLLAGKKLAKPFIDALAQIVK